MTGQATIADVARLSGVSIKSVSRVINDEPHVSARLRGKVEQAVAALGYVPNVAARSLAGARAFSIGILFDNPSPNYTLKVQNGAYAACHRAGYQLVVERVDTGGAAIAGEMAAIVRRRLDGMIVTPPATDCDAVLDCLERANVPYVRIAPFAHPGRSPAISMDDAGAAGEVARHFWDLGHRRFALVNGPAAHSAAGLRRTGFRAALRALGANDPIEVAGSFTFASGVEGGLVLFDRADRPTAVFAANDDMAAGVFTAAMRRGLTVPGDVSVAGFDDSWIAESVWPELTTIYQPMEAMAAAAADMLIARAPADTPTLRLDHRLVIRGSTCPPASI